MIEASSCLVGTLNLGLQNLIAKGETLRLRTRWFVDTCQTGPAEDVENMPLEVQDLTGIFMVQAVAIVASVLVRMLQQWLPVHILFPPLGEEECPPEEDSYEKRVEMLRRELAPASSVPAAREQEEKKAKAASDGASIQLGTVSATEGNV